MKKLVRRHGALVSGVTAVSIGLAIVIKQLLQAFISWTSLLPYGSGDILTPTASHALVIALPFAAGFFLSLWIVAPIAEELRVPHVITRAVLATGIGATLVFVVLAVLAILGAFSTSGTLFGNSFPSPTFDGFLAASGLGHALTNALLAFVELVPLGVLAGVLLWLWRKDHAPRHPLSGLIDEV